MRCEQLSNVGRLLHISPRPLSTHLIDVCQTLQFLSPPRREQFQARDSRPVTWLFGYLPNNFVRHNKLNSWGLWQTNSRLKPARLPFYWLAMVGIDWFGYLGGRRGRKASRRFRSCGDLTIYPIREIRGNNRIIYGDQFDAEDESQARRENVYFIRSNEFHHEALLAGGEYSQVDQAEPFYYEISLGQRREERYQSQPRTNPSA